MKRIATMGLVGWMLLAGSGCGTEGGEANDTSADSTPQAPAGTDDGLATTRNDPAPTSGGTAAAQSTAGSGVVSITLSEAVRDSDLSGIRTALERGASVNQGDDKFNITPLMLAAQRQCLACVKLIVEAGADLDARNAATATALMLAAMGGSSSIVQYLLEQGADVTLQTPSGKTALTQANGRVDDEHKAMIIVLLEQAERISP